MTGRVVRRAAAALSAVAIVAGGSMAGGAGTAAAQFPNPNNWWLQLEADFLNSAGSSDRVGCPSSELHLDQRVAGDVTFRRLVNTSEYRGSNYSVSYRTDGGDDTRTVNRLTDYPPSTDYKLKSLRVVWSETVDGVPVRKSVENPTYTVDDESGAVTFTGAYPIYADYIVFTYEGVPWSAKEGSVQRSGGGFTVDGMEPQDWPVMEGNSFEVVKSPLTCGPNYHPGIG